MWTLQTLGLERTSKWHKWRLIGDACNNMPSTLQAVLLVVPYRYNCQKAMRSPNKTQLAWRRLHTLYAYVEGTVVYQKISRAGVTNIVSTLWWGVSCIPSASAVVVAAPVALMQELHPAVPFFSIEELRVGFTNLLLTSDSRCIAETYTFDQPLRRYKRYIGMWCRRCPLERVLTVKHEFRVRVDLWNSHLRII